MEIITILGDSLSIPRSEVSYKNTYSFQLNELLSTKFTVVNRGRRNNTVVKQIEKENLFEDILYYKESKYFIMHLGVVDCAPRVFSQTERKLLALIRPRRIAHNIISFKSRHRYFLTKFFPKVYVSETLFRENLQLLIESIIEKTASQKIFIINIADTNERNKSRSFGFEGNIQSYNSIISEVVISNKDKIQVVDLFTFTNNNPDSLLEDGIHLSKKAHDYLANNIFNKIRKLENI